MPERRLAAGATLLAAATVLSACGDTTHIPQAQSKPPFEASSVAIAQTGNAAVQVIPSKVTFGKDDAGLLVVRAELHSTAATLQTVDVRVSIYGPSGALVGDANGTAGDVAAGATVPVQLSGPAPNGTIARAVFEVTSKQP